MPALVRPRITAGIAIAGGDGGPAAPAARVSQAVPGRRAAPGPQAPGRLAPWWQRRQRRHRRRRRPWCPRLTRSLKDIDPQTNTLLRRSQADVCACAATVLLWIRWKLPTGWTPRLVLDPHDRGC